MKFSTGIALLSLVASSSVALAQQADAPVVAQPTAPARPEVTGAVRPEGVQNSNGTDVNRTGPDVVNGLEVPQMKNPQEGGRQ
jgi:hypothetical protein